MKLLNSWVFGKKKLLRTAARSVDSFLSSFTVGITLLHVRRCCLCPYCVLQIFGYLQVLTSSGFVEGKGQGGGQLLPSHKFWAVGKLSENVRPKMQNLGLTTTILRNLGAKMKFWARIISSIAAVCRKIATSCPAELTHDAAAYVLSGRWNN